VGMCKCLTGRESGGLGLGRDADGTYGDAEHSQHDAVGQEGFEGDTHFEEGTGAVLCLEDWAGVSRIEVEVDCGVEAQVEVS
jgi:hypothetical protein